MESIEIGRFLFCQRLFQLFHLDMHYAVRCTRGGCQDKESQFLRSGSGFRGFLNYRNRSTVLKDKIIEPIVIIPDLMLINIIENIECLIAETARDCDIVGNKIRLSAGRIAAYEGEIFPLLVKIFPQLVFVSGHLYAFLLEEIVNFLYSFLYFFYNDAYLSIFIKLDSEDKVNLQFQKQEVPLARCHITYVLVRTEVVFER